MNQVCSPAGGKTRTSGACRPVISARPPIWHDELAMSRSQSSRFPVTVSRLPVTRCEVCGRALAYRPGQASAVLTAHYHRMHPEALAEPADSPD
jgi:ribosomal protein S27E